MLTFILKCNISRFLFFNFFTFFIYVETTQSRKINYKEIQRSGASKKHTGWLTVHLLCFTRRRLFVVFYVCAVSHVIKSLYIVFAPNKHVSFIFHKFVLN